MKKVYFGLLILFLLNCSTEESTETTPTTLTDIDGNTYTAIRIGKQTWYKENLNVSKYSDGTIIPEVSDPEDWKKLTTGAWCYYDFDSGAGEAFGKLYNWYAVAGIFDSTSLTNASLRKKLAPEGCHIPSDTEWTYLANDLGTNAGGKMKEEGIENWVESDDNVTNSSNFTGFPGGICVTNGSFHLIGFHGYWWSSTSRDSETAWHRSLNYNSNVVCRSYDNIKYGLSVRFVKD